MSSPPMPPTASAANASDPSPELSLPPSVTGPVYGILSLELHEVMHISPQQRDGWRKEEEEEEDSSNGNTAVKFRVVWWGDPVSKEGATPNTQLLLT